MLIVIVNEATKFVANELREIRVPYSENRLQMWHRYWQTLGPKFKYYTTDTFIHRAFGRLEGGHCEWLGNICLTTQPFVENDEIALRFVRLIPDAVTELDLQLRFCSGKDTEYLDNAEYLDRLYSQFHTADLLQRYRYVCEFLKANLKKDWTVVDYIAGWFVVRELYPNGEVGDLAHTAVSHIFEKHHYMAADMMLQNYSQQMFDEMFIGIRPPQVNFVEVRRSAKDLYRAYIVSMYACEPLLAVGDFLDRGLGVLGEGVREIIVGVDYTFGEYTVFQCRKDGTGYTYERSREEIDEQVLTSESAKATLNRIPRYSKMWEVTE